MQDRRQPIYARRSSCCVKMAVFVSTWPVSITPTSGWYLQCSPELVLPWKAVPQSLNGKRNWLRLVRYLSCAISYQLLRRPCSDFMDMLRRLISCRIIIIIITCKLVSYLPHGIYYLCYHLPCEMLYLSSSASLFCHYYMNVSVILAHWSSLQTE